MASGKRRLLYVFPVALNLRAHWLDRVRAASASGYDVHIAVPFEESLQRIDFGGATLHDLPLRRGLPSLMGEPLLIRKLWSLIRRLKPDLLHAVTIRPVLYGGLIARLTQVPGVVFSVTGLGYLYDESKPLARFLRAFAEAALRFAFSHRRAGVIFENPDDRDLFVARGLVDRGKTHVFVGGGLDLDAFAFTAETHTDHPLVILPARLLADKGIREFVEAARQLKAQGSTARFALVGDIDLANPNAIAPAELEAWKVEGAIEAWGWRENLDEIMQQSAIVCLPSYREGAPRVLMEAAAIGRAVVAADAAGSRHVVVDGETGLLVPVRDAPALAAALGRLLADPDLRLRMGQAARAHAERHFSSPLAVERMLSVYTELASSNA